MSRSFGIALPTSLVALALALATGCGGSGGNSPVAGEPISFQELTRSASTSADATSGRFAFDMTMSFPGADEPFAFSGDGAFDVRSGRASFSMDMSSLASLLGGLFAGMAGPNTVGAPDFAIAFLRGVSGEIETVGSETLRGAQTTHYHATIDPLAYAKLVPPDKRQELQSLVEQMATQAGLGEIPVDVWLDESGLVRKLTMAFSATQPGTSEQSDVSMTFELYDYGDTVDIDLPPASEVVDASAVGS